MEATFIQTCKRLPFLNRLYVLTVCSILCLSTLGMLYSMTYLTILYLLHATGMRFGLLAVKGAVQVASQARGKKLPTKALLVVARTFRPSCNGRKSNYAGSSLWRCIRLLHRRFSPCSCPGRYPAAMSVHSASSPPAFTLQSTAWKIKVWTSALTCPAQLLAFASA